MSANLDRAAAAVRRLVTPRVLGFASCLPSNGGAREALAICRSLTNPDGAQQAHRTLVRMLSADLATVGCADPEFLVIVNALVDYLSASGYRFTGGHWEREATPSVEPGLHLCEAE